MNTDIYEFLGVPRSAPDAEIKAAWEREKKLYAARHSAEAADETFRKIGSAYILVPPQENAAPEETPAEEVPAAVKEGDFDFFGMIFAVPRHNEFVLACPDCVHWSICSGNWYPEKYHLFDFCRASNEFCHRMSGDRNDFSIKPGSEKRMMVIRYMGAQNSQTLKNFNLFMQSIWKGRPK